MNALPAPLKKPGSSLGSKRRPSVRSMKAMARQREAEAKDRDGALYGPQSSDVRFLRARGYAIVRAGLLFGLDNRTVDGSELVRVADRERRLIGIAV